MRPMPDIEHLAGGAHQTLSDEKAGRQLAIFARSPHDDGNAVALDSDFQRLFSGQVIDPLRPGATVNPVQSNFSDAAPRRV